MNIDYFDQIWEEEKYDKERSRISWDNRAVEFNRPGPDERREKIIELLLDKQMLHKNSTVLDIGCGPGKFLLEFAQRAKHAVGVDLSPKMLHYAAENAAALGLDNTEFREMDWDEADLTALNWKKNFSLVTAIMSPAFGNRKGLEKMMNASHEYCLIVHFVEQHNIIGDALKKVVLGRDTDHEYGNRALYCSFNVLWLYKLFPAIVYFNTERTVMRTLEEAGRNYINKFEAKTALTTSQKTGIWEFLKSKAQNEIINEKTTSKMACIYWRNTFR